MDKNLEEWYELHKFHFYSGSYETKDLAEFIGVSERTIQRWLKDKTKPNDKQLAKIRKYLEKQESPKEAI
ncbi:MAG: helix-turn-helix transcriptional regulator [Candidatus Omnitrophica bacterium]|nr:helix-turn-helix transcriptional regulator [Candidatus Omnitrophota bacterium]